MKNKDLLVITIGCLLCSITLSIALHSFVKAMNKIEDVDNRLQRLEASLLWLNDAPEPQ